MHYFYNRSESLEVGDRILAINGKSTDNLTHSEVISLLKNAEDVITLEIEYETAGESMPMHTVSLHVKVIVVVMVVFTVYLTPTF